MEVLETDVIPGLKARDYCFTLYGTVAIQFFNSSLEQGLFTAD